MMSRHAAPPLNRDDVFGLIKVGLDAHTLGISTLGQLLEDCGIRVAMVDEQVSEALNHIADHNNLALFKSWLFANRVTHLGFSYRLDANQALESFAKMVHQLDADPRLAPMTSQGQIKAIHFAGLPSACDAVRQHFAGRVKVFNGDETPTETLVKLGVPDALLPTQLQQSGAYAERLHQFGRDLIASGAHERITPPPRPTYPEAGSKKDHLAKRLEHARKRGHLPLMRAHVGPYLPDRLEALALMEQWMTTLAASGFLDIVSVGSSQLTQSHFGEDWTGLPNGGGVPIQSPEEFERVWSAARPMLMRAYSGTTRVPQKAQVLEESINCAWHALSLWWFSQLDGRGPLDVLSNLKEHMSALRVIAGYGKPAETNIPHHFAFRGTDDVGYLVSAYLGARAAKACGIRYYVLQNMMSVPKQIFGLPDLIRSRALLRLVRKLEDKDFTIIYQPRAGLDFFSPDTTRAMGQLAAVTALMADVEPAEAASPPIIHVVSHSEGSHLAEPETINESVQIVRAALGHYTQLARDPELHQLTRGPHIQSEVDAAVTEAEAMIAHMEAHIQSLHTPEGLYRVLFDGYIPVPHLWGARQEFGSATDWATRVRHGRVDLVDQDGSRIDMAHRLALIEQRRAAHS